MKIQEKVMKYAFIGYGLFSDFVSCWSHCRVCLTKRDIMALVSAALFVAVGFF